MDNAKLYKWRMERYALHTETNSSPRMLGYSTLLDIVNPSIFKGQKMNPGKT